MTLAAYLPALAGDVAFHMLLLDSAIDHTLLVNFGSGPAYLDESLELFTR